MDQRILEFIGDLRRAELRISPSEALDALAASTEIGLESRETFKAALATTLVKESRDYATFDRIFDLYVLDLQALGSGLKKALGPEDPRIQEMLDRLASEEGLEMDELTELMLRGEGSDMEMAIREGGQTAGLERLMYFLQTGYFSRRIYDKFDWEAIERDLSRIMQMLEAKGMDPGMLARIRNYLDLRLEAFRKMIRQHVERELERRAYRAGERLTREVLTDKPLFALSPDEVAQMRRWSLGSRARSRTRSRCASARRRRAGSTPGGPSARACSTAASPWRYASAGAIARSPSWSPCATSPTRCAMRRASCSSSCGACRSASPASGPTCSSRRSPR
jgi:uncharacterized protein with von Willebrand factor type A (vWA) domain